MPDIDVLPLQPHAPAPVLYHHVSFQILTPEHPLLDPRYTLRVESPTAEEFQAFLPKLLSALRDSCGFAPGELRSLREGAKSCCIRADEKSYEAGLRVGHIWQIIIALSFAP